MKKVFITIIAMLLPIILIAGSGDVNGDGYINKADIDAIIKYIMGETSSITKEAADVNNDKKVNVADIVALIPMIKNESQDKIFTENIGDWSEMRLSDDGSLLAVKNMTDMGTPEKLLMILPNEELGIMYSYTLFDDNGMPKYITINESTIIVDSYYDNYVDLTVFYDNKTAYTVTGLPFNSLNVRKTRAANENNFARNATAIVEMVLGFADVVTGSLLITGSVVIEAGTLGGLTVISVPGIIAGTATIAGGVSSFRTGWDKLNTPGVHESNIQNTIELKVAGDLYANLPEYAYERGVLPQEYAEYLRDPNYVNELNRAGRISFLVGLTTGVVDNLYGRTVTWDDLRRFYGNGKVLTGINKDVTSRSATVRGYISPSITVSQLNGSQLENEYGIVVYSTSDKNDRQIQKMSNGSGGMIEYTFNNLKPNTTYNYRTFYVDKTNAISLLDETKSFKTLGEPPIIKDFTITKSQFSKGGFLNDSQRFNYCFAVSVNVYLEDDKNVDEWGYVYKDPNGQTKKIRLDNFQNPYTDARWVYYRNQAQSTCTLYGFVKYVDSDEPVYGEQHDYPLIYEEGMKKCPDDNHPHWIDLGLSSRTLWRCCNEGATKPEEYGGYYVFGQIASAPGLPETKELIHECSSEWTTLNGVSGRRFKGPNGGTIFLPAAGELHEGNIKYAGSLGRYFTSMICEPIDLYMGDAWCLYFTPSYADWWDFYSPDSEHSVRPVRFK